MESNPPQQQSMQTKKKVGKQQNKSGSKQPTLKQIQSQYLEELKTIKQRFDLFDADEAIRQAKENTQLVQALGATKNKITGKNSLRKLEALVGEKFMESKIPNFDNTPLKEQRLYLEAILADDLFSSALSFLGTTPEGAAGYVANLAYEYGPKIVSWLYNWAREKMSGYADIKSHGSGRGLVSVPLTRGFDYVDSNTVSLNYIAAIICPEKFASIIPDSTANQLTNAAKTQTITLTSGADGNFLGYMLPDALTQLSATVSSWQIANSASTSTTNIQAGTTNVANYTAGLFSTGGPNSFQRFRAGPGSIRLVMQLAPLNRSGAITLAYSSENPVGDQIGTVFPNVTQAQVLQFPYCHIAGIAGTNEMRQIHIPHDPDELSLEPFFVTMPEQQDAGGYDIMYISGEGLPVGTAFAKMYITAQMDYMAGTALAGTVKQEFAPDAPGSIPCVCSILKKMPHIAQLNLDDAIELAEKIVSLPKNNYSYVVASVLELAGKHKPRSRSAIEVDGPKDDSAMSFSME